MQRLHRVTVLLLVASLSFPPTAVSQNPPKETGGAQPPAGHPSVRPEKSAPEPSPQAASQPASPAPKPAAGAAADSAASVANESRLLSEARQLVFEGRRSGEGYFSPDGKALIFQSEREPKNPFYQIYILDLESGDCLRVSPGTGKTTCAFFRPGTDEVLFSSTHHDPAFEAKAKAEVEFRASGQKKRYAWDYDDGMDIFTARRDGSALRRLTDAPGYDAEAAYSPDGSKIVFCSLRDAYPVEKLSEEDRKRLETDSAHFGEIYLMEADGSNQRRLTSVPGYDGGPFFTPDGERIVWRRFEVGGALADIYTMRLDGSDVRRLTDFGSMSWAPYFHPSGKYAIFASNKLGFSNFELFLVDALGLREPVRVTFTEGFDGLPVFSPEGSRLAWTSTRTSDGSAQIHLARWNHEAAVSALDAAPMRAAVAPATAAAAAGVSPKEREARPGAAEPITQEQLLARLRSSVEYLASDELEGRMAGSEGARKASEYIAKRLEEAGVVPFGDAGGWFQEFDFHAGVRLVSGGNRLTLLRQGAEPAEYVVEKDFQPLAFTSNAEVEGEVVFAGYGLVAPGESQAGYDSYAGLDVSGKVVLALRYVPEGVDAKRRAELNRYAGLRYKVMLARERGAKGILFVTGPNSPNAGQLAGMNFETGVAGSGIVAASIAGRVADAILSGSGPLGPGKDLKGLQDAMDKEDPHGPGGFVVPGVKVRIVTSVEYVKKRDRNVLGYLPPAAETEGQKSDSKGPDGDEYILVGAHYDHIGLGDSSSLAGEGEASQVHNGADDNASGTAVVLGLSALLARDRKERPEAFRRGVIFGLWTGEEVGLVGSTHFAEHAPVPLSSIAAYVNFDMVGRLRENKLMLQGIGSSPVWRRLVEKRNVAVGLNAVLQDDPYLPTDATGFYTRQLPILNFFTGGHEDYHRPTDDAGTLNYEGMERITRLARGILIDVAGGLSRPEYAKVARSDAGRGGRENLRVYLGTIPDYTGQTEGLKLTGVRPGGPADKGGLKAGDVVVEFGGQKVANIYDYTYALDAAKVGQPVKVVVIRDGQRTELTVVPEARK